MSPAYRGTLQNLGAEYAGRRWVEDGVLITSSSASGGVDEGLHVVAKHRDRRSSRRMQHWVGGMAS